MFQVRLDREIQPGSIGAGLPARYDFAKHFRSKWCSCQRCSIKRLILAFTNAGKGRGLPSPHYVNQFRTKSARITSSNGASSTVSLAEGTHPEIVGPQYIEVALPGLSGKNVRLELSGNSTENGQEFRGRGGEPKGRELQEITKEVVGTRALPTRSLFACDILYMMLPRVSLVKQTSAPLRF